MGQKVHPTGIRLGIASDWTAKWYADSKNFADFLEQDLEVRKFLKKKLSHASVSRIQIERPARTVLTEQERGVHVEELRETLEHGGVLDVAVAVDHVRPARPRQVDAAFFEEVRDLRVGRLCAGLGLGNVHQEPQAVGEIDCRSLALFFGHGR